MQKPTELLDKLLIEFTALYFRISWAPPPYGGIAWGFDRLMAILCNTPSIRDVIAFPKMAKGACLMTGSPGHVEPNQLRDLHLELKVAKKE